MESTIANYTPKLSNISQQYKSPPMRKRAIVCVTNDLSTDQRVKKTCLTLQKCGYNVLEIGRKLPDSLPFDPPYDVKRMKLRRNKGALFYAEYNIRLFFVLLFSKVDLIYSNDLDTLLACYLASKIRRKKLIYDTHEYFTEAPELVHRPKTKRVWERIEQHIFPKLRKVITVCDSIAHIYQKKYGLPVTVVRNIPQTFTPKTIKSRKELNLPEEKKILIIQGSGINVDRGAEEVVEALNYLSDQYLLLIVGNGDVIPQLKQNVKQKKLEKKVIFKSKMPFEELRQYTINADIGLTVDKDSNCNYLFSLPNKLFDYIHSEIPILSSQLVEIKNIIERYDIGYFIPNHSPKDIATTIERIFSDSKKLEKIKENLKLTKKDLCWEKEEKILINLILK